MHLAKKYLKSIPLIVFLHEKTVIAFRRYRFYKAIKNYNHPKAKHVKLALKNLDKQLSKGEQDSIDILEKERQRLLSDHRMLVDGTLNGEGPYDKDQSVSVSCNVSKRPKPALLLYFLAKELKPRSIIELGTNVGISSAYIGLGAKTNKNSSQIFTFEASPYRIRIASEIHDKLGLSTINYIQGLFSETLASSLDNITDIDLVFIDGHHQYQPTLDYFDKIYKKSNANTVYVFDDIRWSDGMKKAWNKIQNDKRVGLAIDLVSVGICLGKNKNDSNKVILNPIKII